MKNKRMPAKEKRGNEATLAASTEHNSWPFLEQIGPHKKKRAFLAAYAILGNMRLAARKAGISKQSHYNWLKNDTTYADAFAQSKMVACDSLEDEAVRRAVQGITQYRYYKGQLVMVPALGDDGKPMVDKHGKIVMVPLIEHKYSDTLLIFLLKAALPEKYRERYARTRVDTEKHHRTGKQVDDFDFEGKTPKQIQAEQLERIEALRRQVGADGQLDQE